MAHTAGPVGGDSRVVLVTGASSGIGEAVCLAAAARSAHVVLLARGRGALERVAEECDRLDVVVSCAGVVAYGSLAEVPPEVFDGVITTNVLGPVNLARHVLPCCVSATRAAWCWSDR